MGELWRDIARAIIFLLPILTRWGIYGDGLFLAL